MSGPPRDRLRPRHPELAAVSPPDVAISLTGPGAGRGDARPDRNAPPDEWAPSPPRSAALRRRTAPALAGSTAYAISLGPSAGRAATPSRGCERARHSMESARAASLARGVARGGRRKGHGSRAVGPARSPGSAGPGRPKRGAWGASPAARSARRAGLRSVMPGTPGARSVGDGRARPPSARPRGRGRRRLAGWLRAKPCEGGILRPPRAVEREGRRFAIHGRRKDRADAIPSAEDATPRSRTITTPSCERRGCRRASARALSVRRALCGRSRARMTSRSRASRAAKRRHARTASRPVPAPDGRTLPPRGDLRRPRAGRGWDG